MVRRTKEDAEQTRQSLMDAAETVFSRKGVARASLEEIAREAGVTRGAVYWHFQNKYDIFIAIVERVRLPMDALYERAARENPPLNALMEFCVQTLQSLARDIRTQRVFSILMFKCEQAECTGEIDGRKQRKALIVERFRRVFEACERAGNLAGDLTPQTAALALHAFMTGLFVDYLRDPEGHDIDQAAPVVVAMFFRGVTRHLPGIVTS